MHRANGITLEKIARVEIGKELGRRSIGKFLLLTMKGWGETHTYLGIPEDLPPDGNHTVRWRSSTLGAESERLPAGYQWHRCGSIPFCLSALF
jgi:hypothetical protein